MAGKFGVLWGRRKGGNECYRSDRHAALPLDLISYHSSIYIPVCVLSCFSRVRLCDPVDCSLSGSSVRGILQTRILEWDAVPAFTGSSWPKDSTCISEVSCTVRQALYHWCHLGSPSIVQSLSCVRLFATPWTAAHEAPPAFTISWSLLWLMMSQWCHSTILSLVIRCKLIYIFTSLKWQLKIVYI